MAFAEKDAIVPQLFDSLGAAMDFVDVFDAAVDAMQAEAHADSALFGRQGALEMAEGRQAATGGPRYDGLVGE